MSDEFPDHQRRVAACFPEGSVEHRVALYHDHLEDELGEVPDDIRAHVEVLTRDKDDTYASYIHSVAASDDPVAIAVKVADLRDNLKRCSGEYGGEVKPFLASRYEWALIHLRARVRGENDD